MTDAETIEAYTAGEPVPAVDPADMRRVREAGNRVLGDADKSAEGGIGIDIRLFVEVCSPGANVPAVCFRGFLITLMLHMDLLNPWRRGEDLDDDVYRLAAEFPLAGIEHFNPAEFLARLEKQNDL